MQDMTYEDIDWDLLWQNARKKKTWKRKSAGDWDLKAESFARRTADSRYNTMFMDLLAPEKDWTVLDVGCGPGNLSIPLARRVRHVSALDFSPKMLEILNRRAEKEQIANISSCRLSWGDDWKAGGLAVHDVVIASRSLGAADLRPALEKMNRFAAREVVVTDRVGHGPFDPAAFRAVGRTLESGPDYIYTINMLYRMGIHASVGFIRLENSHVYGSMDEAFDNYVWMFKDLIDSESDRLREYVESIAGADDRGNVVLRPEHVTTWAFLRWSVRR
jgi:SAM-dependent methyltransferase